MEGLDKQRIMGEYYGYPKCCIDSWCKNHPQFYFDRPEVQQKASLEGFVPCLAHSHEIMRGEVTHEQLITDRICPTPFPDQGSDKDVDKYLAKYVKELLKRK